MINRKNLLLTFLLLPGFIGGVCLPIWITDSAIQYSDSSMAWWYPLADNLRTILTGIACLPVGILLLLVPRFVLLWLKGTFLSRIADFILGHSSMFGLRVLGLFCAISFLWSVPYAVGKLVEFLKTWIGP